MYNFVPLYDEFDTIVECAELKLKEKFNVLNTTEYKMCMHRTLVCDTLYEDYEAYKNDEITQKF